MSASIEQFIETETFESPVADYSNVLALVSHLPSTSAKIRELNRLGYQRGTIAKALGKRYQHVRNVLVTPTKR